MFKIFVLEDFVILNVPEYIKNKDAVLFQRLSNKFVNKVIHGVGLSVAVDERFVGCESRILQTDGCAHYKITFKLLVFAPGLNDTFKATLTSFGKNYIRFSVGFFSDIQTIPSLLPPKYT